MNYNNQPQGYENKNPGYNNQNPGYNNQNPGYNNQNPGYNNQNPGYNNYNQPIQTQPPMNPQYGPGPTVIIQQNTQRESLRTWSSTLCACCDDMESCCCTLFFPCCYLQYLLSKYGECCCACLILPQPAMFLRIQHRNRHKISGSLVDDCLTSTFCGMCIVCQTKRDMDYVMATKGDLEF